jgi:hypothetical protein
MREIGKEICGITVREHIKTGSKIWYLSSDWFFSKDWNPSNGSKKERYRRERNLGSILKTTSVHLKRNPL